MQEFYIINPNIYFRNEGEDGGILFNSLTGEVKILNECASIIFQCFDGNHTKDQIIKILEECFSDTERSKLEQDISQFLNELKEKHFIGSILT